MSDVFGRPLNLQSTQGHTNRSPLAPDNVGGAEQTDPFGGIRAPGEPSAPGVGAAFQQEMMGSAGGIRTSQAQSRPGGDPTTAPTVWHGSPGGNVMPPATPRPEMPLDPSGIGDPFTGDASDPFATDIH